MKVSKKGYKKNSKYKNEPALMVPSSEITMKEDNGEPLKKGAILGTDNTGYSQMMYPGLDYSFPGSYVYELPMAKNGMSAPGLSKVIGGKLEISYDKDRNVYLRTLDSDTWTKIEGDQAKEFRTKFAQYMPGYFDPAGSIKQISKKAAKQVGAKQQIVDDKPKYQEVPQEVEPAQEVAQAPQSPLQQVAAGVPPMLARSAAQPTFGDKILSEIGNPEKIRQTKLQSKYQTSPDYHVTPYASVAIANKEYEKTIDYKLRHKNINDYSTEDIPKIQEKLYNEGYLQKPEQLDISAYKSKDQVIELQKKLAKFGLMDMLGKGGPNKDGITGTLTKETKDAVKRFNELNKTYKPGELDDMTKQAIKDFKNSTDSKNAMGLPVVNPKELYDPETGEPYTDKTYEAMSIFENSLKSKGYFLGDEGFDISESVAANPKISFNFTLSPDSTTAFGHCAQYVNGTVCKEDIVGEEARDELGFKGSAWHISENLQEKGGQLVFAGLPDRSSINLNGKNEIRKYLKSQLTSPDIKAQLQNIVGDGNIYGETTKIRPGDVVNIFYEGSGFTEEAYDQTKSLNNRFFTTHVGIVKADKGGNLYVEHNIHGKIEKDKIQDFIDGKIKGNGNNRVSLISGITRPNYVDGVDKDAKIPVTGVSYYQTEEGKFKPRGVFANPGDFLAQGISGENTHKYLTTIEKNKNKLLKDIPISETEFGKLMRVARVIPTLETYAGQNAEEEQTIAYQIEKGLKDIVSEKSTGFTKLKDASNLGEDLRQNLYQNDDSQLTNPVKAAIPTFYLLSKNYLYLKEVANRNNIDITSDELAKLAGLAYNQSIGKIAGELVDKGSYQNYYNYRVKTATDPGGQFKYRKVMDLYDTQTMKEGGITAPGRFRNPEGNWLTKYQGDTEGSQVKPTFLLPKEEQEKYLSSLQNRESSDPIDITLDVASYSPGLVGMFASAMGAGKNLQEGDYTGAALDAANVLTAGAAKYFNWAKGAAKSAGASRVARSMADKADFLEKASNPNIYKTIGLGRDLYNYPYPESESKYFTKEDDYNFAKPSTTDVKKPGLPIKPLILKGSGGDISIPDLSRPNWLSKYQDGSEVTPGMQPSGYKRSDYVPYKDVSGAPYETQDPYIHNFSTVDVPENLSELPSYRMYTYGKNQVYSPISSYKNVPKPNAKPINKYGDIDYADTYVQPKYDQYIYRNFDPKTGYNYELNQENLQPFQSIPMEGEKEFNLRRFVLNPYEGQPQTHDLYIKEDGTVDKENFIPKSYSREETMDNVFKDLYAQNLYKFNGDRDAAYNATSDFMKERVEPQYKGKYYEYMNNPNVSADDKLNINLKGSHMTVNPQQTEDYVRQQITNKLIEEHPEYMEKDESGNYKMSDEDFSNLVKADPRYKEKLNEYNDVLQDWYVTNKNMSPEEAKALVEKDLYKNVPKRKTIYATFKKGGWLDKYQDKGEVKTTFKDWGTGVPKPTPPIRNPLSEADLRKGYTWSPELGVIAPQVEITAERPYDLVSVPGGHGSMVTAKRYKDGNLGYSPETAAAMNASNEIARSNNLDPITLGLAAGAAPIGATAAKLLPWLNVPATVGSTTLPYVTAGNILGTMAGYHGAQMAGSDIDSGYYTSDAPMSDKVLRGLETGLNLLGTPGAMEATALGLSKVAQPIKGAYNTVATGESFLPVAWKSPAVGLTQSASDDMFRSLVNSGKLTPEERALVLEYQHGSREFTGRGLHKVNQEKRQALNNIINKYKAEIGDDVVLTRMFSDSPDALGATLENGRLNFGDRPTSFTAGVQPAGYARSVNRVVIPRRYSKQMGDKFLVNQYDTPSEEVINVLPEKVRDFASSWVGPNAPVVQERELIGTGLDFRQIGKVKNDIGGYDLIVKPNSPTTKFADLNQPVKYRKGLVEDYNPETQMYEMYEVNLPSRITPGRPYEDVQHKMRSLRKDLGIGYIEHLANKYIPGFAKQYPLDKGSGLVIDPQSGRLFDSNTRYWLNREYGITPKIDPLLQDRARYIGRNYGTKISESAEPVHKTPGIKWQREPSNTEDFMSSKLPGSPNSKGPGPMMLGLPNYTHEVKNVDYFKKMLDSYSSNKLSNKSKKYFEGIINSVRKQDGMATKKQYDMLQRLRTGDFNYGKRGAVDSGPDDIDWLQEEIRFTTLPELNNPQASEVLDNFMTRINTPEGKRRLKELGITEKYVFDKLKIVGDENTLGHYWLNKIGLHPDLPEFKNVTRHEIEHAVQDAYNRSRLNEAFKFKWTDLLGKTKKSERLSEASKKITTDIDESLKGLELRRTPQEVDWNAIKTNDPKKDPSQLFNYISDKQRATNYFASGSGGKEKSPFLAEVQQYMMDQGILPKTSYIEVTPEMVKNTFTDALFDETGSGKYLRLFQIMKPTEANYKLIADNLNKMLGIAPVIGLGTAAALQKEKDGGWLYKYQVGEEVKSQQNQKYQDAIKWHEDWMNSPMYKQMLYEGTGYSKFPSVSTLAAGDFDFDPNDWGAVHNYDPNLIDAQRREALSDLKKTPLKISDWKESGAGGLYDPRTKDISVYPIGYNEPMLMEHEVRHAMDTQHYPILDNSGNTMYSSYKGIPKKDTDYLKAIKERKFEDSPMFGKLTNEDEIDNWYGNRSYIQTPTEVNARLAEIRREAQQKNIYDPFTQPIPTDFFKNFDNRALQELKNYYTDEEIQHMLNHFSYNQNQPNDTGIYQSKLGGKVKLKKYQRIGEVKQNQTPPANLPWINQQGQFTQVPAAAMKPKSFEARVDEYLGNPMQKGQDLASWAAGPGNDPVDNLRHMKTAEEITTKGGSSLGSAIVANALGAAHELYVLPQTIKSDGLYHGLMSIGEDIINNAVGSLVGATPLSPEAKESLMIYLSDNDMVPDGVSMPKGDMYWKKKNGGESQVEPDGREMAEDLRRIWNLGQPSFTRPSSYNEYRPKFGWSRGSMTPEERAYEQEYLRQKYSPIPGLHIDLYGLQTIVDLQNLIFGKQKKNGGINSSGEGYYDYINGYSIFAKGGVSSKKSSWLNKYK